MTAQRVAFWGRLAGGVRLGSRARASSRWPSLSGR